MDSPFESYQFSSANLFRALSNARCTPDAVAEQERAQYLYRYLSDIGAKTIILESEYIDGDYLEDFASYYVRCFQEYERKCKRLHFFARQLADDEIKQLILGELDASAVKSIVDDYLGFVVARPLPVAIVGRTSLATYPPDSGRRHYPVVQPCSANFFGVELCVQSLPYQEQDSVLAACATVALWSAFRKTASMFGTPSPRPAAITRAASSVEHRGRSVPSPGLRIAAMCHAVSDVGLEPELVPCEHRELPLISLIYAHLAMGLPVILVVRIQDVGLHAVTLTGFSLRDARVQTEERVEGNPCVPMTGLRIDELYAHDDQIGPFARLSISPAPRLTFTGDWTQAGKKLEISPVAALLPVYNKIRLTFLDVQEWLNRVHNVVSQLLPPNDLEWDVRLTTTNQYKSHQLGASVRRSDRERILLHPQPRFFWCATLSYRVVGRVELLLELLIDATDMRRSFPVLDVIFRNDQFRTAVTSLTKLEAMQASLTTALTAPLLELFKRAE